MKDKRVIIVLILIVLVVGIFMAYKVVSDLNKEKTIRNEIKEISKVFTIANIDDDEVDVILDRRLIKKGDYAKVESSIKEYYKSLYSDLKNLTFLLDDDNFTYYLSSKNINDDGPNFIKSRSNLANSKVQIDEYYTKFTESLNNDDKKKVYLKDGMRKYYVDFYLELTNLAISNDFPDLLKQEYDLVLKNIEVYGQAFDFLTANKGAWKVEHDEFKINDTVLYDEYISIKDNINKNKKESNKS